MQNIVFGPILSRRFGLSLGVDLSPSHKQCNFDCLYCELGGAKTMPQMQEVVDLSKVLEEIQKALESHQEIDVISVTASGEPTLYPFLLPLSQEIAKLIQNRKCKSLILSNGSNFGNQIEALNHFDIVKFSLDCISPVCFRKLDRPNKELEIQKILEGIANFAKQYKGELVGEVLVIKGLNDNLQEMQKIAEFMRQIGVHRVDLGSIDRPPAYAIEGVSFSKLQELSEAFVSLCVSIPVRQNAEIQEKLSLSSEKELLELLHRRPLSVEEFPLLFSHQSFELLQTALLQHKICIKNVANMDFYAIP